MRNFEYDENKSQWSGVITYRDQNIRIMALHIFIMKRLQNKKLLDVGVAPLCLPRRDLGNHGGIAPTNNIMNMCNARNLHLPRSSILGVPSRTNL